METLAEVRALLTQQQALKLALEKDFKSTPMGTKEWGDTRRQLDQLSLDIRRTSDRQLALLAGGQPSLL